MKKFDFNDYKYILNKFKIEKITYNICNSQDIPIHKFYRYVIKKKNNERIRFDGRKSYFKTFKKAALALLREKGIIDESKDNKMANFIIMSKIKKVLMNSIKDILITMI